MGEAPLRRILCPLIVGPILSVNCAAQPKSPGSAVPLEPTTAILDVFKTHDVVALGEGTHGNEQGHIFRLSLIREPRFLATVNDIVVEFGNSLYQDVMDRFVRNESVSPKDLQKVWQNTTNAHYPWEKPIYEEFFRAVRSVNTSLPPDRQLRVLLGEPPINWDLIRTKEDADPWLDQRETYPANLIRREVLAKHHKALVIYGDGHFFRDTPYDSIVTLLEKPPTSTVFAIATITDVDLGTRQPDVGAWPRPSLTILRGTALGTTELRVLLPLYRGEWLKEMEKHFDAILYLGPPSRITYSRFTTALCADNDYIQMRLQRMSLYPFLVSEADRLRRTCQLPAQKQGG
jgi:hypothetical protein